MQMTDGTTVTIEGTADEVASLLERFSGSKPAKSAVGSGRSERGESFSKAPTKKGAKSRPTGPTDYVRGLVAEGFFATKRGLADIQKELERGAHFYPLTTLSPTMVRLVRQHEVRRLKENGQWMYVNR
jgi:hypothetical protein